MLPTDDTDWRRYLEQLLRPSVVLLEVGEKPAASGFLISSDGLICTASHAFVALEAPVSARWRDRRLPAERLVVRGDCALLRIEIEPGETTPALPIYLGEQGDSLEHHPAATFGYAGLKTEQMPHAPRLLLGSLGETFPAGRDRRIVLQDLGEGEGNSGAPIFDLDLLRVVGHVTAAPPELRRLGDGVSSRVLVETAAERFPELLTEWRESGRALDREVAEYLRERREVPVGALPAGVLNALVEDHNRTIVDGYCRRGIYRPETYAPRRLEEEIKGYLAQPDAPPVMVVAGLTGSGKTCLLLHLADEAETGAWRPILIPCRDVDEATLPIATLRPLAVPGRPEITLRSLVSRCPGARWVMIFEGLNEWPLFRVERWRRAIAEIDRLSRELPGGSVRFLFSVRLEFLQERLGELWNPEAYLAEGPEVDLGLFLFSRSEPRRPFHELECSAEPTGELGVSELERLYDRYRDAGLRPKTPFEHLSETVRNMLTLPLLLSLFMQRYSDLEVPESGLRSELIEDIVLPILEQKGEASGIFRQDATDLLEELAALVLREGRGLGGLYRAQIKGRPWHDRGILEILLSSSPILFAARTENNDHWIGFRSDWFFEYFLASHLWNLHFRGDDGPHAATIERILAPVDDSQMQLHLLRAFVFLAEWSLTRDPSRSRLIVQLINLTQPPEFARGFTQSFLDFLRMHEGFDQPVQSPKGKPVTLTQLLDERATELSASGLAHLLDYAEQLERNGNHRPALQLLSGPTRLWSELSSEIERARHRLCLAYNSLVLADVDAADRAAREVPAASLPPELAAKRCFALGRCHQYRQRYRKAEQEFTRGSDPSTRFGIRCLHQRAFIKVLWRSDYAGARSDLERIIPNPMLPPDADRASGSRVLHATCLALLGEYDAAEAALLGVADASRRLRRNYQESKAQRALADLYLRRFRRDAAVAAAERSLECMERTARPTGQGSTIEVLAAIHTLLDGDLAAAEQELADALERVGNHGPSASWICQTRALVAALAGDREARRRWLAESRRRFTNPNQRLREQFIEHLGAFLTAQAADPALAGRVAALRRCYRRRSYGWYPEVLGLLGVALRGGPGPNDAWIARLFGDRVACEDVRRSYLFQQLFPGEDSLGSQAVGAPRSTPS